MFAVAWTDWFFFSCSRRLFSVRAPLMICSHGHGPCLYECAVAALSIHVSICQPWCSDFCGWLFRSQTFDMVDRIVGIRRMSSKTVWRRVLEAKLDANFVHVDGRFEISCFRSALWRHECQYDQVAIGSILSQLIKVLRTFACNHWPKHFLSIIDQLNSFSDQFSPFTFHDFKLWNVNWFHFSDLLKRVHTIRSTSCSWVKIMHINEAEGKFACAWFSSKLV